MSEQKMNKRKVWIKRILVAALVALIIGAAFVYYIFNLTYDDTKEVKTDYSVSAMPFLNEFRQNEADANKKYSEKIIAVSGRVSATEMVDTTFNIKFIDTTDNSYIIFAFQLQNMNDAKKLKSGDSVTIKGSCSNGTHSDILGVTYITFKRSVVSH